MIDRHDLERAWLDMHGANIAAHRAGRVASNAAPTRNPHPHSTDAWYWWNEGYHRRPFCVLTDNAALTAKLSGRPHPNDPRQHTAGHDDAPQAGHRESATGPEGVLVSFSPTD